MLICFHFVVEVDDVPLPDEYRSRINNNYDDLLRDLDLKGILPKLRQHRS